MMEKQQIEKKESVSGSNLIKTLLTAGFITGLSAVAVANSPETTSAEAHEIKMESKKTELINSVEKVKDYEQQLMSILEKEPVFKEAILEGNKVQLKRLMNKSGDAVLVIYANGKPTSIKIVDVKGQFDITMYDRFDSNGNPGIDGIFEEQKVALNADTVKARLERGETKLTSPETIRFVASNNGGESKLVPVGKFADNLDKEGGVTSDVLRSFQDRAAKILQEIIEEKTGTAQYTDYLTQK